MAPFTRHHPVAGLRLPSGPLRELTATQEQKGCSHHFPAPRGPGQGFTTPTSHPMAAGLSPPSLLNSL